MTCEEPERAFTSHGYIWIEKRRPNNLLAGNLGLFKGLSELPKQSGAPRGHKTHILVRAVRWSPDGSLIFSTEAFNLYSNGSKWIRSQTFPRYNRNSIGWILESRWNGVRSGRRISTGTMSNGATWPVTSDHCYELEPVKFPCPSIHMIYFPLTTSFSEPDAIMQVIKQSTHRWRCWSMTETRRLRLCHQDAPSPWNPSIFILYHFNTTTWKLC
jgi:hypothetical protein